MMTERSRPLPSAFGSPGLATRISSAYSREDPSASTPVRDQDVASTSTGRDAPRYASTSTYGAAPVPPATPAIAKDVSDEDSDGDFFIMRRQQPRSRTKPRPAKPPTRTSSSKKSSQPSRARSETVGKSPAPSSDTVGGSAPRKRKKAEREQSDVLVISLLSDSDDDLEPKRLRRGKKGSGGNGSDTSASSRKSATPPPQLSRDEQERQALILKRALMNYSSRANPQLQIVIDDDDDDDLSGATDPDKTLDLNPALALVYTGPDAAKVRAAARRKEEERRSAEKAARAAARESESLSAAKEAEIISSDVEAIDEEKSQSSPSDNGSDSDFEIVQHRSSAVALARARLQARKQSATGASPPSDPAGAMSPPAIAQPQPAAAATAEGRISIKLLGKGNLVVPAALVRPTTTMDKIVAVFISQHTSEIPAASHSQVHARLDGEALAPTSSVDDAELEDGDQLEIAW